MQPGLCSAEQSVLVIIDIQQRLVAAMPEKIVERTVANTSRLLQAANLLSIPVMHTEQYPKGLGNTVETLDQNLADAALSKTCFSCCGADNFLPALTNKKRQQVILTGMESHVCVLQTAMELAQDYQVFVAEDAICSRNKHHHRNALARMQQAGIVVTNHESVMFEWLKDANHDSFKQVSALLK